MDSRQSGRAGYSVCDSSGDIVENDKAREWNRAVAAMSKLDSEVPYALSIGNHDYGDLETRETRLNDYF